ncbi:hypothetical protein LguiB_009242 [Lonicera macranthoides]
MNMSGSKSQVAEKSTSNQRNSRRERKLTLLEEVEMLKRKLRHEENLHRALERAFNRPLGALPRLPPYLPPYILELLAEVAVLEEEVARLEEQFVSFRQGLYQESVNVSLKTTENTPDSKEFLVTCLKQEQIVEVNLGSSRPQLSPSIPTSASRRKLFRSKTVSDRMEHCDSKPMNGEQALKKGDSSSEDSQGKENQTFLNSMKYKITPIKTPVKKPPVKPKSMEKCINPIKLQRNIMENVAISRKENPRLRS